MAEAGIKLPRSRKKSNLHDDDTLIICMAATSCEECVHAAPHGQDKPPQVSMVQVVLIL